MKFFNYEYIICGFGNSTLGCILGLVGKRSSSKILVIEQMTEKDFFSNEHLTYKEDIIFQHNNATNGENLEFVHDAINKKREMWDYANIIGLSREYTKNDLKVLNKNMKELDKKYQFDHSDAFNMHPFIEKNFQEYRKTKKGAVIKASNEWDMFDKPTFMDAVKYFVRVGVLEIVFECKVERIVFRGNKAEEIEAVQHGELCRWNIPSKLVLGCGTKSCAELLFKSGVGERHALNRNNVTVNIENNEIGKNIVLNPYVETFYRETQSKHFFISKIEFILAAIEKMVFIQILIGIASYFLYNLLYTEIAVSAVKYKVFLFIVLAASDSFFLFVFRWNNFMIVGYLLGFLYIAILFVIDSRYYVRYFPFFLLYWASYYVFYLIYVYGYYKYVGSLLNYVSKNTFKIYSRYCIFSFYRRDKYEKIIRSGNGLMYKLLNYVYYIVYYYLWTKIWMYKDLFIVKIELYQHSYDARYIWSDQDCSFLLCTDFFKGNSTHKLTNAFRFYEEFIKDMFISQKYSIYDKTISKKANEKSVANNMVFGGYIAGSCGVGKVVEKTTQKLIGSSNVHIIGLPTLSLGQYKKKTLNNTISLLNGYGFANN